MSEALPSKVIIHVQHVKQSYSWDCGIACIKMVLSDSLRQCYCDMLSSLSGELNFGKRVWTIDMAYMLHRLGVNHMYCTVTIGVDPSYESKMYYNHKCFLAEQQRVNNLFRRAKERGVRVESRSLDMLEILKHLSSERPVIVLTNSWLLKCSCWAHSMNLLVPACSRRNRYAGHYVVVCGYDMEERVVLFRNPGYSDGICKSTFENFADAWKSHGTDEDVIFILDKL